MSLDIPAKERGRLHLFALNETPSDPPEPPEPDPRPAEILGITDLNPDYAEIVTIKALRPMSLADYLAEGYDIDDSQLAPTRARINALEGHVLVVLSLAFRDQPHSLASGANLTHVASLQTEGPDWQSSAQVTAESARPGTAPTGKKRPSDAAMMGRIAMLALLLMFTLTALLIWIAA